MQITIKYEGEIFTSKETDEATVQEAVDEFYPIMGEIDRFMMELEDGGTLLLPLEAARRCVMIIK